VGGTIAGTLSLMGNGKVVQFQPTSALPANHNFQVTAQNLTNTSGVAAPTANLYFTTGTASDSTAPTVTAVAPQNGTLNVGINATVRVIFSKTIDSISVNGSTIQISGAGQTEIPASITFDTTGTIVTISPLMPLPASTQITVAINGVTDPQGNLVVPKSTTFTTGTGPDTAAADVIAVNPDTSAVNVPTNSPIIIQFNKQMDSTTVTNATLALYDNVTGQLVAGSISASADMKTFSFIPSGPLPVGRSFTIVSGTGNFLGLGSALDLTGNPQQFFEVSFTTGSGEDMTPPQVTETNPGNGVSGVGTNALAQIEFNKGISPTSVGQVVLLQGGSPIAVTSALSNLSQTLTLTPAIPLAANTTYTISITGVQDFAGNTLVGTLTKNFTTGPGVDLTAPTIISITPASNTTVPDNTKIQVQFSKAMNPLTLDPTVSPGDLTLVTTNTSTPVPFAISFSADLTTATVTPTGGLAAGTQYTFTVASGTDASGNLLQAGGTVNFTTQ
jgi:hypothetical protein